MSSLRTPFGSQRVNGIQTLQKSAREYFYPQSVIDRAGGRPS